MVSLVCVFPNILLFISKSLCYCIFFYDLYITTISEFLFCFCLDIIGQVVACEDLDNYDKNGRAGKKKPITLIDAE